MSLSVLITPFCLQLFTKVTGKAARFGGVPREVFKTLPFVNAEVSLAAFFACRFQYRRSFSRGCLCEL